MKILVIGGGGREHALVWKISQSPTIPKIYCAPGNPGTFSLAQNVPINVDELSQLLAFAKKQKIDITMVGPEMPLVCGIVDLFEKNNLVIIGPNKKAAQIEGSKIFAKKLMQKYKIPTAKFKTFTQYPKALSYLSKQSFPQVVKADGLASGKGVAVCQTLKEGKEFLKMLMADKIFNTSGSKVVIEEYLEGPEISFMLITDGHHFVSLLPSQDHKRVFDNDQGPNTGGMGAYAPVAFVNQKLIERIEKEIVGPTIAAMKKEGCMYKGILYPGIIVTKDGPKVLEFNCRFGDPETQPLMSLLETDLIAIFKAIQESKVHTLKLKWKKGAAVCVMLTARGYPGNFEKGKEIKGLEKLPKSVAIFHSGTALDNGKLVTGGGRVMGVTAVSSSLKKALDTVYNSIGEQGIHFSGMHRRSDIGKKGLV